jgi:hypothetical protein
VGPVPLVLDLHITHEDWGSSSDPSINGHLHYPNDVDRPLNEDVTDKIRAYHTDYNNHPSNVISFMSVFASTSGRLHNEFVHLLFLPHRELTAFLKVQEFISRNLPVDFSTSVARCSPNNSKSKWENILTKVV